MLRQVWNTGGYFLGEKLKITEGNPEELPQIKSCRAFGSDDLTVAIGRRVICNIRKPKFVRPREVDQGKGFFLKIDRDRLECFPDDPIRGI